MKKTRKPKRSKRRRPVTRADIAMASQQAALSHPNDGAIVRVQNEPIQMLSQIPTIQSTVKSLEKVRRFVMQCMNVDLKKALARIEMLKLPKLTKYQVSDLEVDWGTIPGVNKPFLKQPGAEKVLFWLNLRPKFYKQETELPGGHLEMVCHVTLFHKKTKEEVFEGPDCSCSTMESNFRFRFQAREEGEPVPTREEQELLKRQGLGKNKKISRWVRGVRQPEEWVWHDRFENPNIHDERNKVRQMAEKRALVKAVKNMGAFSELFTADPTEWDIPEEDEDPFMEQDFTESGRRIVDETGHAPSGKAVTPEARHQDTQTVGQAKTEELKKKVEEVPKPAPRAPAPPKAPIVRKVEVRTMVGDEFAVTGFLEDLQMERFLADVAAKSFVANADKRTWWRVEERYRSGFDALCKKLELEVA